MTDASPVAQNSNADDLPPVAVEATPSIVADQVSGNAMSRATSLSSTSTVRDEESRDRSGGHCKWHADVLVDGHTILRGFVRDISMKSADLFIDHNLQDMKLVTLNIHIPPLIATSHPHVMEVSASIGLAVYDSTENYFRYRITFRKFSVVSDQAYFRARLEQVA